MEVVRGAWAPGRRIAALGVAVIVSGLGHSASWGYTCSATDGGGCPLPGATCYVQCTEADLRDVLARVNGCPTNPGPGDVTLALGPDAATTCGTTPIGLAMSPTQPGTAPGACGDDNANRFNALCLANSGTVLDGRGAILTYTGDHICASCDGECTLCGPGPCASRQPALVVLRGSRNTVRDLEMRFFPEGIDLKAGDGHTVERVTARYICENGITVSAGTGHRIAGNTLVGNTVAASAGGACWERRESSACAADADCSTFGSGARCYCGLVSALGSCASPPPSPLWPASTPGQCFVPRGCGLDKAIELNSGGSTVGGDGPGDGNAIHMISEPVHVGGGTHALVNNLTCGHHSDRNLCQAYDVSGGTAVLRGNRIDHCKFGIRVVGSAQVEASDNTVTNGYVSAFQVKGAGTSRLKASGNLMRNNGYTLMTDCQRGALVVQSNPSALVDFGGGDASGTPVLGGTVSGGGNVFCQGVLDHVWNVTDCPCSVTSGCTCTLDGVSCGNACTLPAGPCCALEADGACAGSTGGDASVGIGRVGGASNALEPAPVLSPAANPNVVDRVPVRTRVENAVGYPGCDAIVVDPCECLFEPDGAPCTDGDACTQTDHCSAGVCVGSNPVVCGALDQCHDAGVCDPLSGVCSNPRKPNGTPCDDGDACTPTAVCAGGTCIGAETIGCTALDQCHHAGLCAPATGVCSDPPKPDGTACDSPSLARCSQPDACRRGTCLVGGSGDTDGDLVCDGDDGCPDDADPEQRDLDGDGAGDVCDPHDAALTVTFVRARRVRPASASRFDAVLRGRFTTSVPADQFDVAAGLSVRVRDASGQEPLSQWGPGECRTSPRGRISCRSADDRLVAEFRPLGDGRFRFRFSLRRLQLARPLAGALDVTVRDARAIDRVGTIARRGS